jgi:hypothetical protein
MTIEAKKEETNLEAEKVEESLRDFIGRVPQKPLSPKY